MENILKHTVYPDMAILSSSILPRSPVCPVLYTMDWNECLAKKKDSFGNPVLKIFWRNRFNLAI
jgi:hypothetical protein